MIGSKLTQQTGALASSTVIMLATAAVYSALAAAQGTQLPNTPVGWLAIICIALLCTVVAIVTFFAGLAQTGPSNAATFSTLEPAVTVVLAAFVLGDRLEIYQLAGGLLILAAVIILARSSRRAEPETALIEA